MAGEQASAPAELAEVEALLVRMLPGGELLRVPKHPRQRDVLLALLADGLERRRAYAEIELNEFLRERLQTLRARVDYATARRFLIDYDFLKRDRAGSRYFVNYPRVAQAVTPEALADRERVIDTALAWHAQREQERAERRRAHNKPT